MTGGGGSAVLLLVTLLNMEVGCPLAVSAVASVPSLAELLVKG